MPPIEELPIQEPHSLSKSDNTVNNNSILNMKCHELSTEW